MFLALSFLRLFFSFKVTRAFGPFTMLLKLSSLSLVIWIVLTFVIILVMGNFLSILLHQNSACSGVFSCSGVVFEGGIGRVVFSYLGGNWVAHLSLAGFVTVLGIVIMNMVIARINSAYTEISRRGTLYYYKDLFDLRYNYKLDSKYGYLAALEHPFSVLLLPTLCCVRRLENKRRRAVHNL